MSAVSTTTVAAAPAVRSAGSSGPLGQLWRLYRTELRLFLRESQVLVFVFAFPVLTVLVLGGVFGSDTDDSGFEFINPSHYYIASYFGVVLAAIGLIMLPVHSASYRESGILRRFDAAGFPRWAFPATQVLCGVTFALLGFGALLIAGGLAYGIPGMHDPVATLGALAVGTLAFISFGVALGTVMPTARAAQGIGMLLFFPMFLLAGGGPPPEALPSVMQSIANFMPLTHIIRAAQEPWLDLGSGSPHLAIVAAILLVSAAIWVAQSRRVTQSS